MDHYKNIIENNIENIIIFIISKDTNYFELEYLDRYNEFERVYDINKYINFYNNYELYSHCNNPKWLLDKLLLIDKKDSIDKFAFTNLIKYLKIKKIYENIKNIYI